MDKNIFVKMKVKPDFFAYVMNPPDGYPMEGLDFTFKKDGDRFDFVHLFVNEKKEFEEYVDQAKDKCKEDSILWVSYPKGNKKVKYDVNRDILWDLSLPHGLHPVAQIALDDKWSAIRLKPHNVEENEKYQRPVKHK